MVSLEELVKLVRSNGRQWVRLKDGWPACLVEVLDENSGKFLWTFIPCAKNATKYETKFSDIVELEAR